LLHGVLDAIVDGQYLATETPGATAEDLEDHLFMQRQTGDERRHAVRLRRALSEPRSVVVLTNRAEQQLNETTKNLRRGP
jgi:magnesium transporter